MPPARIVSTSSMLSAPVSIPPMIEVSFPAGFAAPEDTRRGGEVDMGVDQVRQAGLFGECQHRIQPGRRNEIAFVEHRGPSRERVR
ncbi:MAG TPA: hypothetical protein VJ777_23775 [Mycobacterium sp.]|nr:hypothetical protein [Mycobacterium sp.]